MANTQIENKRQLVNTTLHSTKIARALQKIDGSAPNAISKQVFSIPAPVKTSNKMPLSDDISLEIPKSRADSLQFIRSCGFPGAKSGAYPGMLDDSPVIPESGLRALSFVLDTVPKASIDGKEFLTRAMSSFGQKEPDYSKIVNGLTDAQIAAGVILLKVVTEGLSGLSGDLFVDKKFKLALERQRPGSSDGVLAGVLDTQFDILRAVSDFIRGS